jgi:hypothetical protein
MGGRGSKGRALPQPLSEPFRQLVDEDRYGPRDIPPPEENPTTATATEQDQPAGLEDRVQDVYRELASKPQDWVKLSRLREALGNPDNQEMARILKTMTRTGMVHLAPDSDRKNLTAAEADGRGVVGSEDKHLIAIEPDFFDHTPDAKEGTR